MSGNLKVEHIAQDTRGNKNPHEMKEIERRAGGEKQEINGTKLQLRNGSSNTGNQVVRKGMIFESTRHPAEREDFEATGNDSYFAGKQKKAHG